MYFWHLRYHLNGYIPLSVARNVALYKLFFTKGDSRSKMAIVVIRPVFGSILSQLAGSESLEYLGEGEKKVLKVINYQK